MKYCSFCNREHGDNDLHVIPCPKCDGQVHQVNLREYECSFCGGKFTNFDLPHLPIQRIDQVLQEPFQVLTEVEDCLFIEKPEKGHPVRK